MFAKPAFYDSYGEAWVLYEWAAKAWIFTAGGIPELAGVAASQSFDVILLQTTLYRRISC